MPVGRSKAYVPEIFGERLFRVGKNRVGIEDLAANVNGARKLIGTALPKRKHQGEVLLSVAEVCRLPRNRLIGEPGDAIVGTVGNMTDRAHERRKRNGWSDGSFGRRSGLLRRLVGRIRRRRQHFLFFLRGGGVRPQVWRRPGG